jgi:prephenate dehydrogenase/3-phosphoshikimate 1-carboxyvinyltransferase
MLGALAQGQTRIQGFLEGADAISTMNVFRALGVSIDGPRAGQVVVEGVGLHGLKPASSPLDCGNAGTAMRLLMGLLCGQAFDSTLVGDESLSKRPMKRVSVPLGQMGAKIDTTAAGTPPVVLHGGQRLVGLDYELPMASAQVKSAVLLAGLYAQGRTRVTEPAPTRDHTERMLGGFGVEVVRDGASAQIQGGQVLRAAAIDVPADISSAAFFMVAAAIAPDSELRLLHVGINPTRTGVIDILQAMGAHIRLENERTAGGEPVADLVITCPNGLRGIDIEPQWVPLAIDEFPVLFVAAACAHGTTVLRGAEELRVKESDRIAVMAEGLKALGIDAQPTEDGMVIHGRGEHREVFGSATVQSHGDHRIAMAFAVASLRAAGEIKILDTLNVGTSFPGFDALARHVGIDLVRQTG